MAYKGQFTPKYPKKYIGDPSKITYRSMWERNVMKWLDEKANVEEWGSEELAIPYEHPIRGGRARYYPDFIIKFPDGTMKVVEIKPKKETVKPEKPSRQTKKYLNEVMTFAINSQKWEAAEEVCKKNGLIFEIWTEDTLAEMGILHTSPENKKQVLREGREKPKLKPVRKTRKTLPRPKRKS